MLSAWWMSAGKVCGAGCAAACANSTRAVASTKAGEPFASWLLACEQGRARKQQWPRVKRATIRKGRSVQPGQDSSLRGNEFVWAWQHASPGPRMAALHDAEQHPPGLAAVRGDSARPDRLSGVGRQAARIPAPWGSTAPRLRHAAQRPAAPAAVTTSPAAAPPRRQHPAAATGRPCDKTVWLSRLETTLCPWLSRLLGADGQHVHMHVPARRGQGWAQERWRGGGGESQGCGRLPCGQGKLHRSRIHPSSSSPVGCRAGGKKQVQGLLLQLRPLTATCPQMNARDAQSVRAAAAENCTPCAVLCRQPFTPLPPAIWAAPLARPALRFY